MALREMAFEAAELPTKVGRGPVSSSIVSGFDELAPHLEAWDRLGWEAPQQIANLLPAWIDAFLRHRLGPKDSWLCIFAYLEDNLVGVLPLIVTPHPVLGSAHPLLRTPHDGLTPSGDILLDPEHAEAALRALLEEAGRAIPGHLGIDLRAVRSSSPLWQALNGGVAGYSVRTGRQNFFAYLDVKGSFQDHLASLGKTRGHLKRFRRKLEARGKVSVTVDKGADFLEEFISLEASGWKGRAHSAIAQDPKVADFYRRLVGNFVEQGRWEWLALRVDDKVVAAQMCVRCGTSLAVPKTAYDENYAEGRPGTLSSEELLKSAFSRPEIEDVNPMSDGPLHRLWHMSRDSYVDVHLVRRSLAATFLQLPRVVLADVYQRHVRPRIPPSVKRAYEEFGRRGNRKPRRAGEGAGKGIDQSD